MTCEDCGQKPAARGGKCWACIKKSQRLNKKEAPKSPQLEVPKIQKIEEREQTHAIPVGPDTPGAKKRESWKQGVLITQYVIPGGHYIGKTDPIWSECLNPDCPAAV